MTKSKKPTNQVVLIVVGIIVLLFIGYFFYTANQSSLSSEVSVIEVPAGNTQPALTSTTWVWQETLMNNDDVISPTTPGDFTLEFGEDGQVFGTTDCNSFRGSYTVSEGDQIAFGPFASTMMFCEESQETEFTQLVSDSTSFIFDAEGNLILLLKFDSGSSVFTPATE